MFASVANKGRVLGYTPTYLISLSGTAPVPLPNIHDFGKPMKTGLGFLFLFLPGAGHGSQDLGHARPTICH